LRFTPQEEKFTRSSSIKKILLAVIAKGNKRHTKIGVSLIDGTKNDRTFTFSHPDYTVGFGIAPNPAFTARGLKETLSYYRRSGISPCPEDESILTYIVYYMKKTTICKLLELTNGCFLF
jgi:hypothetical protein